VTTDDVRKVLQRCKEKGLKNILALRGDPPKALEGGDEKWKATEGGFAHAVDLVRFIRKEFGDYFCIGVAAYPEGHPDSMESKETIEQDFKYFKDKVEAGADFAVTQLFYDVSLYFKFVEKCKANGLHLGIFPGIMPIQNYGGFQRMTGFCKTFIPKQLDEDLKPISGDDAAVRAFGIDYAVKMCSELLEGGAPGVHLYTLNLETAAMAIVEKLNLVDDTRANREMPWVSTISAARSKEDVRPIFWAQRPRSYVERTEAWDEFPNGRFGNCESPAFGDFTGHSLVTEKLSAQRRQQWSFNGFDGLEQVFARFLKPGTEVTTLPWCPDMPGDETVCIRKQLIQLCSAGFLTINSQPRVNGTLSTDPLFGWGPSNGVVYQKAYVEFFCSPEAFGDFKEGIAEYSQINWMAVKRDGTCERNVESGHDTTAVTWGVFPGREIAQPTVVDVNAFMAWKDEAFALWDEWVDAIPQEDAVNRKLLRTIQGNWYLVNVVDNDFLSGDLFATLLSKCAIRKGPMRKNMSNMEFALLAKDLD